MRKYFVVLFVLTIQVLFTSAKADIIQSDALIFDGSFNGKFTQQQDGSLLFDGFSVVPNGDSTSVELVSKSETEYALRIDGKVDFIFDQAVNSFDLPLATTRWTNGWATWVMYQSALNNDSDSDSVTSSSSSSWKREYLDNYEITHNGAGGGSELLSITESNGFNRVSFSSFGSNTEFTVFLTKSVPVSEPAPLALLALGLAFLGLRRFAAKK